MNFRNIWLKIDFVFGCILWFSGASFRAISWTDTNGPKTRCHFLAISYLCYFLGHSTVACQISVHYVNVFFRMKIDTLFHSFTQPFLQMKFFVGKPPPSMGDFEKSPFNVGPFFVIRALGALVQKNSSTLLGDFSKSITVVWYPTSKKQGTIHLYRAVSIQSCAMKWPLFRGIRLPIGKRIRLLILLSSTYPTKEGHFFHQFKHKVKMLEVSCCMI